MPQLPSIILDANAFIEPKNRFYAFDICPGFWDFIIDIFASGNAGSIMPVRDEILAGGDNLSTWMKGSLNKVSFYDCIADPQVVAEYQRVASYVQTAYSKPQVVHDFLKPGAADPWIVAHALAYDATVVTQETHKSRGKKVSLFDVCNHFGIHHVDVFEFIRSAHAQFVYVKEKAAP